MSKSSFLRAIAIALALCFLSRSAQAACAASDNDCLLRLVLQQTYALEASKRENEILQKRYEDAEAHAGSGSTYFLVGAIAGVVLFGLASVAAHQASK